MKHRIFALVMVLLLTLCLTLPAAALEELSYIMDNADLLSETQQTELESRAQGLAEEYGCGVYVLTVNTMNGAEQRAFAEDFYMKNNLGVGDYRNGILFLVCIDTRDYVTITYGQDPQDPKEYGIGILAFTDAGIAQMEDDVVPMLSDGDYDEAFEVYLDSCEEFLSYYDAHGEGMVPTDFGSILLRLSIVILLPLIIAFAVCLILFCQMKTAKAATNAGDYIPGESFVLTAKRDRFIHTTRHREKINNDSDSGSSVGSSGFGGSSGGKF